MPASERDLSMQMFRLATGHFAVQALFVAAKLAFPDHLASTPQTAEDLARLTGAHTPSLRRLLRALVTVGVFERLGDGRFAATPLSRTLESDSPNSVRNGVLVFGSALHWNPWGDLLHSVTTGESAFGHVFGRPLFEHLDRDPEAGQVFHAWMDQTSRLITPVLLGAYDFSAFGSIVDVGGGNGALVTALLRKHGALRGVLFDLPGSVERAATLVDVELRDRCEYVGGDFFVGVPPGADAYLLKLILHDWADEACVRILSNCRCAMKSGARIVIVDSIVGDDAPGFASFLDLSMLVLTEGGRERTLEELRALTDAAGLAIRRVVPTPLSLSIVEVEAA